MVVKPPRIPVMKNKRTLPATGGTAAAISPIAKQPARLTVSVASGPPTVRLAR